MNCENYLLYIHILCARQIKYSIMRSRKKELHREPKTLQWTHVSYVRVLEYLFMKFETLVKTLNTKETVLIFWHTL